MDETVSDDRAKSALEPPATPAQLAMMVGAVLALVILLIAATGAPHMAMPGGSWVDTWLLP